MWFASALRSVGLALALSVTAILGGCTLSPLYGDAAQAEAALTLAYAEPNSRLEQIVYQTLSARLGGNTPGAPVFSASVSTSTTRIGLSAVPGPVQDRQVVATITYRVTQGETVLASGTRSATAGFQTTGQILTDQTAQTGAQEQATRAAAETVRLALIAALAPR